VVERCLRTAEARGSTPLTSTKEVLIEPTPERGASVGSRRNRLQGDGTVPLILAAAVVALGFGLQIYTRGFREGPMWAHTATFALVMAGIVAAVSLVGIMIICAINLAWWITVGVFIVAMTVLGMMAIGYGLWAALTGDW
jgi:hypothetical protein